jgi:hypothetical protein
MAAHAVLRQPLLHIPMSELESPLDAPAAQGGQNCRYKYTASLLLVAVAAGVIALVAVNHASHAPQHSDGNKAQRPDAQAAAIPGATTPGATTDVQLWGIPWAMRIGPGR